MNAEYVFFSDCSLNEVVFVAYRLYAQHVEHLGDRRTFALDKFTTPEGVADFARIVAVRFLVLCERILRQLLALGPGLP